jgi:hypothetical protein
VPCSRVIRIDLHRGIPAIQNSAVHVPNAGQRPSLLLPELFLAICQLAGFFTEFHKVVSSRRRCGTRGMAAARGTARGQLHSCALAPCAKTVTIPWMRHICEQGVTSRHNHRWYLSRRQSSSANRNITKPTVGNLPRQSTSSGRRPVRNMGKSLHARIWLVTTDYAESPGTIFTDCTCSDAYSFTENRP